MKCLLQSVLKYSVAITKGLNDFADNTDIRFALFETKHIFTNIEKGNETITVQK